jgi:SAM-dependent methyltransferase
MRYQDVLPNLRSFYDANVAERDGVDISPWKAKERGVFLEFLRERRAQTLLEVGSGPGRDGVFFRDQGLKVTCTDLSPAMVASCRAKGLEALTVDFLQLDFAGRTFDAVYALNSLLHVPKVDLPDVLERIRAQLVPGGLFYLGVYGGNDFEGVRVDDRHEPKRFFAFYRDRDLLTRLMTHFEPVYFRQVAVSEERDAGFHFQSVVLQRTIS